MNSYKPMALETLIRMLYQIKIPKNSWTNQNHSSLPKKRKKKKTIFTIKKKDRLSQFMTNKNYISVKSPFYSATRLI